MRYAGSKRRIKLRVKTEALLAPQGVCVRGFLTVRGRGLRGEEGEEGGGPVSKRSCCQISQQSKTAQFKEKNFTDVKKKTFTSNMYQH